MGALRNPSGPLIHATLYKIAECIFFGQTRPPTIDPRDDDAAYTVTNFDRIDLIADQQMGDSQLWWVILLRNNLRLAPNDLVPGEKIFIPTVAGLRSRGIIQ